MDESSIARDRSLSDLEETLLDELRIYDFMRNEIQSEVITDSSEKVERAIEAVNKHHNAADFTQKSYQSSINTT